MATRLYLRDLTASNPPTTGKKSTANPSGTPGANNATGTLETRSLSLTKGAAQTSIALNSDASTGARTNYLARFTSPPLAAQTLSAETWTTAIAQSEADLNSNKNSVFSLYVWRPSNSSVVGYIYDTNTLRGTEWGATEDGRVVTLVGASLAVLDGDVLVLEFWCGGSQTVASAYAMTVYFDGTTDVIAGTSSDAGSYLEKPAAITWQAAGTQWGAQMSGTWNRIVQS